MHSRLFSIVEYVVIQNPQYSMALRQEGAMKNTSYYVILPTMLSQNTGSDPPKNTPNQGGPLLKAGEKNGNTDSKCGTFTVLIL